MNEDLLNNPENPCESSAFWGGATLKQIRETLNLPKKCKTAFTLAETIILPCKNYNFSFSDYYFSKNHNLRPFKKTFAAFDMKQAAFTLAETMIVLVILGVIATLTVPNLINKQKEATQRTKVKKAMAMYESVVNKMILENDRSFNGLNEAGCNKTVSYFKYIKRDTNNGCRFQTADKLWWDVTNIQRPLIAFKEEDLTKEIANAKDNKKAFVMVGRFDDQGILRVDDLGYESVEGNSEIVDTYDSKDQVAKLYGFINNVKSAKEAQEEVCDAKCDYYKAIDSAPECTQHNFEYCKTKESCWIRVGRDSAYTCEIYVFKDGNIMARSWRYCPSTDVKSCTSNYSISVNNYTYNDCNPSSKICSSSTMIDRNDSRGIITYSCDGNVQNCTSSIDDYNDPRGTVSYLGCDGSGNNCTSSVVPTYTVDGRTITPSGCDGNGVCSSSSVVDSTDPRGTVSYSGCDGVGNNCTSSQISSNNGITYNGCNGNGVCTSSHYISGSYEYNCDGNVQNCTVTAYEAPCLARGTMITLSDGSQKTIQDIDFDDELLVWDFDNGKLSFAKPLWIKIAEVTNKYNLLTFSDGRTLKTINQHRIFNKEAGKYTYPMTDDTPLGTTTLLEDGSEVTLVKKEVIEEPVEFYNIMTEYHFNCFANGISTSNRFNNLYPIKDYKFVKEEREVVPYEEYKQIPYEWYEKMRLAEQPREVNRDGADQHADSIANHILNLYIAKNKPKMALV